MQGRMAHNGHLHWLSVTLARHLLELLCREAPHCPMPQLLPRCLLSLLPLHRGHHRDNVVIHGGLGHDARLRLAL